MSMNKMRRNGLRPMLAALLLAIGSTPSMADERQSLEELRNTVVNLLQALVDQGVISKEKANQMVKAAQEKAAADAATVAKSDEGAVRVPYVPQIVKDEIAKQVAQEVKPGVVASVVQEAKDEKWGVPGALADWLTRTRLYGNVTLREEGIFYDKNNAQNTFLNYFAINNAGGFLAAGQNAFESTSEDRIRTRGTARLGLETTLSDSMTAGIRLSTGNSTDLVSENQTLDGTSPYQFGVDELYIRDDQRNAQKFPWLSVVGGRFLNPYETPDDLIFHRDLTFTGAAATGRIGFGDGSAEQSHVFVTLGTHFLQEIQLSPQDKWLVAGQLGTNLRWGEGQHLRLAAGFYDYFNVTGRFNPPDSTIYNYTAPTFLRQGNTVFNIADNSTNPNVGLYALASKFRLADVNATYRIAVGRYEADLIADAVKNLGFNSAEVAANVGSTVPARTKGYQVSASFGDPVVATLGTWRALVGYRYLENDAVIDAYTDSDFHYGGTNARGYYFIGDLGLANRVWMRVRYLSANEIDGPTLGIDTLQLDINTRF